MDEIKKILNPGALLYLGILIVIVLLIGFATSGKNDNDKNKETKNMLENKKVVVMETNLGNIELELYADQAPKTVANFVKLATASFYDNTKFHRVIKGFMIQGGDPYTKGEDTSVYGTGGPGYQFADESNDLPMVRGMIAMANSGPNTNGSQFFIITAPETPWLTGKHTVFGKVISGMETVDKIENSKTDSNDLPLASVVVNKVTVK
jgi:cyclophilin family peptidyl-prolyl cis-trans isomerase